MTIPETVPAQSSPALAVPRPDAPARRGPGSLRKLLVVLAAMVLGTLGAEWALVHFNIERLSFTNPALYVPDAELEYRMRADARVYSHGAWYSTNAAGLRGPHWDGVHAAGKECVLFLGHSIAGGFGVTAEEAFPGVFTALNGRGLVGINLGHSGYRYWQEFALAHRYLEQVRPVATVVMFTGNDFEAPYDPFAESNTDGPGAEIGTMPLPGKAWLRRHSALYQFLRKRWSGLMISAGLREIPERFEYETIKGLDPESKEHFRRYEAGLLRLREESGAPMILTAFPMGQSPESYAELRAIAGRVGARWVDFSDLWKDAQDYRSSGALRWSEHPDAATHRLLGERITRAVEECLR